MMDLSSYCGRGYLVEPYPKWMIEKYASYIVSEFNITASTLINMEGFVESLWRHKFVIDEVADDDWRNKRVEACCTPGRSLIRMPASLCDDLYAGEINAVKVFFHEMGHCLLNHESIFHFESNPVNGHQELSIDFNSEYQADLFAAEVLRLILSSKKGRKAENVNQLDLFK